MKPELPPPPADYCRKHRVLGPGMQKLGISCRHFAELSVEAMDRSLTAREKFRHHFHYLICSICRGFQKQMLSLTALVRMSVATREAEQPDPDFLKAVRQELTRVADEAENGGPSNSA